MPESQMEGQEEGQQGSGCGFSHSLDPTLNCVDLVDLEGSDLARLRTLKQSLISESMRMNETFLPCSPPLEGDKRPQVLSLSP